MSNIPLRHYPEIQERLIFPFYGESPKSSRTSNSSASSSRSHSTPRLSGRISVRPVYSGLEMKESGLKFDQVKCSDKSFARHKYSTLNYSHFRGLNNLNPYTVDVPMYNQTSADYGNCYSHKNQVFERIVALKKPNRWRNLDKWKSETSMMIDYSNFAFFKTYGVASHTSCE
jgi:hypothetical protein